MAAEFENLSDEYRRMRMTVVLKMPRLRCGLMIVET